VIKVTRPKVFVARRLPEPALEVLGRETDFEMNKDDRVLTKEEIMEGVKDKDALLCLLTDKIDAEIMDAGNRLKVISNYAVGFDNIDVEEATKRGIAVTNTPGVLTETTADLTWALMLAVARRIVEADGFIRAGKWRGWAPMQFLGTDVHGKTLGIVGLGRIGAAVAKRAVGFNMKTVYYDARRNEGLEKELGIKYAPLDELLKISDFVTIHVPLLPTTHHLIGERELGLMKPTAYLINTSRGQVIDERALIKALKGRKIAGAALDVFEREPEVPKELIEMSNVVLTPHIGSASVETRTKMAMMAVENLLSVLRGEIPKNLVNHGVIEKLGLKGASDK